MVPLSSFSKPNAQRSAFWDIAFCLLCVAAICQLGYVGARHAAKLFSSPAEIHCGDYVRVKSGFYTGVEGWAKSEKANAHIELEPNTSILPHCILGDYANPNVITMSFAAKLLEHAVEPTEKDIEGQAVLFNEVHRTMVEVSKAGLYEWRQTKPVTVNGIVYGVAIRNYGRTKPTVVPPDDTPL